MLGEEHVDELNEVSNNRYCQLGVDLGGWGNYTECVCGCAVATK